MEATGEVGKVERPGEPTEEPHNHGERPAGVTADPVPGTGGGRGVPRGVGVVEVRGETGEVVLRREGAGGDFTDPGPEGRVWDLGGCGRGVVDFPTFVRGGETGGGGGVVGGGHVVGGRKVWGRKIDGR